MVNATLIKAIRENPKIWANLTVLGVIIYIAIDVVLAFLRPDYSLLHNAESDYGRGPYFWLMDINFMLRFLLSLALVTALLSSFSKNIPVKHASLWLILWSVTSGLLAFFADNPYGYPKLRSGSVHVFIAFIAFIAALIALIMFSRLTAVLKMSKVKTNFMIGLSVVAFVSLILTGRSGFRPHSLGGLYERIFLAAILAGDVVLALSIKAYTQNFSERT